MQSFALSLVSSLAFLWSLALASPDQQLQINTVGDVKECTVTPAGPGKDDVPAILKAFKECNYGGRVLFPKGQRYWIATKLNPVVDTIEIDWQGEWKASSTAHSFSDGGNSYPIEFQNHAAGFILGGKNIKIDGHGTGGIHGNGDVWYNDEEAKTRPGRPMPFVLVNVTDVVVKNFYVIQPQLWAINIMGGKNLEFENIYVNATATRAPWGKNWVQNTDGFDTMDAKDVKLTNFVYQGGDDCIAIKPRSYNIEVRNATCRGGNGMAIGSLGQYQEDSTVENVLVKDVKIIRYNEDMHNCAYIKTWIGESVEQKGYESAGKPRGGGWGIVRNITFSNFDIDGADGAPSINQDNGNNGKHAGSSKMEVSQIVFENFRGHLNGRSSVTSSINCSKVKPCFDIEYRNFKLRPKKGAEGFGTGKCKNIKPGSVKGLAGEGCS
ncbi:putative galacturan 1,4-alpha-galacturonidase C [Microthyrium microscopicum]|uniref:galacturonan 1,4-alpha-galacturonidase n=1 Tax=Microthyrium microscopicum TaxID=703497 RepID=A0A6A6ULU4_9PEZI|nr:putative galacturan 1,4-alpha-galacturonidase C [Microthyrium microscopicum]